MSVGLDIGASQIRCLRHRDGRLIGRSARSLYAALPDAEEHRSLLEAGQIPFAICDNALTLLGDTAAEYSLLFHVRPQSLLPQGRLPTNDPVARQSLAALVDALLGEPDQPGEMCGVTLPGGEAFQSLATSSELEFFSRLIRLRGFFPQVLSAGIAAILSELSRHCFTGLGLSFGAATSELVIAHRGIELLMCSIPQGGDWLDEQIAREFGDTLVNDLGETVLDLTAAAARRWSFSECLHLAQSDAARLLASLHRDLAYALIRSATLAIADQPRMMEIPQPLPVVVVGGVCRIGGFPELLREAFELARFPLSICELQFSTQHDFAVARGCLISAQLESEIRGQRNRAA